MSRQGEAVFDGQFGEVIRSSCMSVSVEMHGRNNFPSVLDSVAGLTVKLT